MYGLSLPSKEHQPLPKLASALGGLLSVVESADVDPTADAVLASEKWDKSAADTLARWTSFLKEDLANANAQLQKVNLKPLLVGESPAAH